MEECLYEEKQISMKEKVANDGPVKKQVNFNRKRYVSRQKKPNKKVWKKAGHNKAGLQGKSVRINDTPLVLDEEQRRDLNHSNDITKQMEIDSKSKQGMFFWRGRDWKVLQ